MKKAFYILYAIFSLVSCKSDDDQEEQELYFGYEYYPLEVNQESIYQIDSIIYDDFSGTVDTLSYQRRELVQSKVIDAEERVKFEIAIFERSDKNSQWVQKKVISRIRTLYKIEELDNNLLSIPIVFPVKNRKSWDINALNILPEEKYSFENVHNSLPTDSMFYDSTLRIVQNGANNQGLSEEKSSIGTYAARVGLIFKEEKDLLTTFDGTVISGYEATLSLIEFKKTN